MEEKGKQGAEGQGILGEEPLEKKRTVDVMFVLDRSGSMADDIEAVRSNIGIFLIELEKQEHASIDWRIGFLAQDATMEWIWLDLCSGLEQFRSKLATVHASKWDEATPHATDYALEHASWRVGAKSFLVVLTDEPAETGHEGAWQKDDPAAWNVLKEKFEAVCSKIAERQIGLCFVHGPGCLSTNTGQGSIGAEMIYDHVRNMPRTFVSDRLHEDKGEKLMSWLAHSVSMARNTPYSGKPAQKDVFGVFSRVRLA